VAWHTLWAVPQSLERLALSLGAVRRPVDARRLEPMRPLNGRPPLVDDDWLYELKVDGFRLLADVRGREVTLRYRSGYDCTHAFPEIVAILRRLRVSRLVLDGEVVAFDERGRPDFDRLGPRLQKTTHPRPPVSFVVFDVLAVGDVDVRRVPLVDRKRLVERIVTRSKGGLRAVPCVAGDGRELVRFIIEHDLEGLVAKRATSPYVPGPSSSWLKLKQRREEEFLVKRYRLDREGRIDAVALVDAQGVPQGNAEIGVWRLREALGESLGGRAGWKPLAKCVAVTVTYLTRTSGGRLREAVVKGLREET
jgi:bifunctional non-homologous end joining protein LigD